MVLPAGSVTAEAELTDPENSGPRMADDPSLIASVAMVCASAAVPLVSLMTSWIVSWPKSCMASSAPFLRSLATVAALPGAVFGMSRVTRTCPWPNTSPCGLGSSGMVACSLPRPSVALPRLADWQEARASTSSRPAARRAASRRAALVVIVSVTISASFFGPCGGRGSEPSLSPV